MTSIDPKLDKAALRKQLLRQRRSLVESEWRAKSHRLCQHLQASPLVERSRTILAYFSFRNEPDLSPLFEDRQRQWGFPRCVGQSLSWHLWKKGDICQPGAFGITEPHPDAPSVSPEAVDLILVPAVACDERGYRLGYGGGFYDRLLSHPDWRSKPTLGIVFDFARLPSIPTEPWDTRLHGICTDAGLKIFE